VAAAQQAGYPVRRTRREKKPVRSSLPGSIEDLQSKTARNLRSET
jgi:hypothetical protein